MLGGRRLLGSSFCYGFCCGRVCVAAALFLGQCGRLLHGRCRRGSLLLFAGLEGRQQGLPQSLQAAGLLARRCFGPAARFGRVFAFEPALLPAGAPAPHGLCFRVCVFFFVLAWGVIAGCADSGCVCYAGLRWWRYIGFCRSGFVCRNCDGCNGRRRCWGFLVPGRVGQGWGCRRRIGFFGRWSMRACCQHIGRRAAVCVVCSLAVCLVRLLCRCGCRLQGCICLHGGRGSIGCIGRIGGLCRWGGSRIAVCFWGLAGLRFSRCR